MNDYDIYPVTIIVDRYSGVYSGGQWLAFNCYHDDVPYEAVADDITCADFFDRNKKKCGIGNTPDEAYDNLKKKLRG